MIHNILRMLSLSQNWGEFNDGFSDNHKFHKIRPLTRESEWRKKNTTYTNLPNFNKTLLTERSPEPSRCCVTRRVLLQFDWNKSQRDRNDDFFLCLNSNSSNARFAAVRSTFASQLNHFENIADFLRNYTKCSAMCAAYSCASKRK